MSGYFQHIKENQEVILVPENEKKTIFVTSTAQTQLIIFIVYA